MKDDAPAPDRPPRKRRQLERVPDLWLAVWLDTSQRPNLTPSDRRRVQEEKDGRKSRGPKTIVGFTGTRAGMTPQQTKRMSILLGELQPVEAHHGDCVGADQTFHTLCRSHMIPIVLHPPSDPKLRAYCQGAARSEPAKPFLDRNKDIVRDTTVLMGAPKETREPPAARGQGTWSTVRYARQRGGPVKVIMPDGKENE